MTVIAHNVASFPPVGTWTDYLDSPEPLTEYELADLDSIGVEECWYWYATGSYEGGGYMIGRTNGGKWFGYDLGHCSCYGPTSVIRVGDAFDTLDAFKAAISDELREQCAHLIAAIEAQP